MTRLWPLSPRRAAAAVLVALIALAIWMRFAFIVTYGGLEASYHEWAMTNYFGAITGTYLGSADALESLQPFPTLGYPPGYPLILVLLRKLGIRDPQDFRHVQAVVEAAVGLPAMYRLARAAGAGRIFSVLGGGFYAVYPLLAVGAGLVMAEALSPMLLLASLCLALWAARRPSRLRLVVLGAWLGAVSLVRPDFVLLSGPIALWLWTAGGVPRRPALVAVLAGGFMMVLLPWGVHNRVAHGAWVFTSTGGSVGLWEGLGAIDNPYGYVLNDDYTARMLSEKGLAWHSVEADRFLLHDYLRAWREHPAFVLQVAAYRWDDILTSSEEFRTDSFRRLQRYLNGYGPWVFVAAVVVGARSGAVWLAVFLPVAYALLTIGLVHYEPRYVRYVHVAYVLAALVVMSRLAEQARRLHWRPATAAMAVVSIASVYTVGEVRLVRDEARAAVMRQGR